jgi:hypothetical protein
MNTPYELISLRKCPQTTSLCYECANALKLDELYCKTKFEMYFLEFGLGASQFCNKYKYLLQKVIKKGK